MANEKRLIDANALISTLEKIAKEDESNYFHLDEITQEIFDTPTVDAVEVVWCDKCGHHDTESCPQNRVWCKMLHRYMKPDGYCSYGVKGETNEKVV